VKRREFMALLGGTAAAWPMAARAQQVAQQPGKVFRVGLLLPSSTEIAGPYIDAFREGLRERGYIEGQNIAFELRLGTPAAASEAALDLARLKIDVILAWTTTMATAAQRATRTIPIVIVGIFDPVGSGLVASLARPGGNVTGLSNFARDLSGKLLEILVEIVPGINSIAALANSSDNPSVHPLLLRETERAVSKLNVRLQTFEVRAPDELDGAFERVAAAGVKGVIVLPGPLFLGERRRIAELAQKARLPTVFARRESVDAGGLLSYGPNLRDQFRQTATYVDRILRGATPAELPVEQPTRIEFVINLKTAKALGLEIPPSLLARADEVIE
jgi:putative tryptophan/tyrosine transport system substrate-binding protein